MELINIHGKRVSKNVSRYLIKWDGKSRSKLQFAVKQFLKPYWRYYIVYEEFPVYGSLLKVDIVNATLKVAIEVHGPQHNEFHFFHNGSVNKFNDSITRDSQKLDWLKKNKFKIIEINHDEVENLTPIYFKERYGIEL